MLVVTRFVIEPATEASFLDRARAAVDALRARPGFRSGRVARAADDPRAWLISTEWVGVGAWRRALGGFEVKLAATPLLAQAIDEPSAYEILYAVEVGGDPVRAEPLRAADAGSVTPRQSLEDQGDR